MFLGNFNTQKGFGLIEVLVSAFIISIGLLGVASMQTSSLKMNQAAYHQSQANILMAEIIDRIRLNRDAFLAGNYDDIDTDDAPPANQTCISDSAGCTGAQLALQDIREFTSYFRDVNSLVGNYVPYVPNGNAEISRDAATDLLTVSITWQEETWAELAGVMGKNLADQQLSITLRI